MINHVDTANPIHSLTQNNHVVVTDRIKQNELANELVSFDGQTLEEHE
jgi:hypothetical protein